MNEDTIVVNNSNSRSSTLESFHTAPEMSEDEYSIPRGFRVNRSGHSSFWTMSPASLGSPRLLSNDSQHSTLTTIPETSESQIDSSGELVLRGMRLVSPGPASRADDYRRVIRSLESEGFYGNYPSSSSRVVMSSGDDNSTIVNSGASSLADSSYISGSDVGPSLDAFKRRGFDMRLTRLNNTPANDDSLEFNLSTPFPHLVPRNRPGLLRGPPGRTPAPRMAPRQLIPAFLQVRDEETEQDVRELERPKTLALQPPKANEARVRFKETML